MRIGYFGDGPWASLALDKITQNSRFEIVFITPRYDTQDPELKKWAEKLDVPFLPHPNVNDAEFLKQIEEFECDILVSMSFNQILRRDIINVTSKGFINCHAGALPFYRGRNPLNWALINGEETFGITVHFVDEGIDTGDIIVQKHFEIGQNDTYGDLLETSFENCANVLMEGLEKIEEGSYTLVKQSNIHPVGTYFGRRIVGDEWIDWMWTSERIHNFIRGITQPGPCARTYINGREIALIASELIKDAPSYIATNGEVLGRNEKGVVVKSNDTTLLITQVADVAEDGSLVNFRTPKFLISRRFTNQNL